MTPITAAITGTGMALPDNRLTNADLESRMDTTDQWIVERTGISERRIGGPEDTTASLAVDAGGQAVKDAGLVPEDIDLLLLATTTADQQCPSTSATVQDMLGLRCGAVDLNAACSGWVYSLVMGSAMVETGRAKNVLVIGSDIVTRFIDPTDRGTAILFGDGAGAAVIQRADNGVGVLGTDLGCDGSAVPILQVRPGARYLEMDGQEVFRRAVRAMVDSATAALERSGLTAADVDLFIPHQANARIISMASNRLGIPEDRNMVNIERYGNTVAASVPIALTEAKEAGRINDGDIVLLVGMGAGMTWASAVVRWGQP